MTIQDELSPRQLRAIDAILTEETQAGAATAARVSVRSLRRWLALPSFGAELARRRAKLMDQAALELSRGAGAAARALVAIAGGTSKGSTARVAAARAVIDLGSRFRDRGELEERIAALEAALATTADAPKGTWQ